MLSVLVSLIIATSPADEAAAALALAKAQRDRPQPVKLATPVKKEATHSHRCPRCGNIWAHADDSFGKIDDHICPKCGYGPVWNVYQRFR